MRARGIAVPAAVVPSALISTVLVVFLSVVFVVGSSAVMQAQVPDAGPGHCVANCGSGNSPDAPAFNTAPLQNAIEQAFTNFLVLLFNGGRDPRVEAQKQQMMEELRLRQEEALRLQREEEARLRAQMFQRLSAQLKLSGLPDLQMKDISSNPSLQMKLGNDDGTGHVGVKGLPGIYLNDGAVPYGIPGLPGIYVGGPGQGSGLTNSNLPMKLGGDTSAPAQAAPLAADSGATPPTEPAAKPGLQVKLGDDSSTTQTPAALMDGTNQDPTKVTPQQLADVMDAFSKLPPEEQQRLLASAQQSAAGAQPTSALHGQPSAQALTPAQQVATASQQSAGAPVLEDVSAAARAGFDQPVQTGPVQLGGAGGTVATLRSPGTAINYSGATAPPPAPGATGLPPAAAVPASDFAQLMMGVQSKASVPFPRDPNPPSTNPLRDEAAVQAKLKSWDDWAFHSAMNVINSDVWLTQTDLNAAMVAQYGPEFVDRFRTDREFREDITLRMMYGASIVAQNYYGTIANAHKAALLRWNAELDRLERSGALTKGMALEDQFRLHPDRMKLVGDIWLRLEADEDRDVQQAGDTLHEMFDKKYRDVFDTLREQQAQQH